ncbi:PfkB family carbohydrate kinase [Comamonadaceae bacterium M7527]|nr:PfkB family carbohydrate kinase [Comamonadaceae bacterium M7527]
MQVTVLGEALMDCLQQPDGQLKPLQGGSPYNLARACALQGVTTQFLNPFSNDAFGTGLKATLLRDGVLLPTLQSQLPTSLAVVQVIDGQPNYGFYREGIADRDYTPSQVLTQLKAMTPGVLHTGSLLLIPPEHLKVKEILQGAKALGWTISMDVNMRPSVAPDLPAYVEAVKLLAEQADWLKASDEDLEILGYCHVSKANAPALCAHFPRASRIALTFGGDGAFLSVNGHTAQAPVPVVTVADTVGAGDTFWGNCLADWANHPTDAAQRVDITLRKAMQAAAINCTRAGCQPPNAQELASAVTN